MKRLIAALGLMLLVSPAFATTVSTSMVLVLTSQTVGCNVVNVGKKPLTITTSIINGLTGTVIFSPTPFPNPPGTGNYATSGGAATDQYVYCSFQFSGSTKDVRGSLVVLDSTTTSALATLPAS